MKVAQTFSHHISIVTAASNVSMATAKQQPHINKVRHTEQINKPSTKQRNTFKASVCLGCFGYLVVGMLRGSSEAADASVMGSLWIASDAFGFVLF